MFCPQCKAEYRFGFTRCSDCGVQLVDLLPVDPPRGDEDNTELVVVRNYVNQFDLELARNALEAAGIESTTRGRIPWAMDLLVKSEDAKAAEEILSVESTDVTKDDDK